MKRTLFILFAILSVAGMVAIGGCKKETYTVTFNANGANGTMQPQEFTEGKAQPLTVNDFTYRGYIFEGWNTTSNGSGDAYTDGETIRVTHDMILYAQWKKVIKPVLVTFDANGGSGEMDPQQFIADEAMALVANAFTNGNYPFSCWNTMADGSGTTYTDMQEITISRNMTLYAQWSSHEFVDLGLPSGTLWANCNVGATNPEDYGDYFAWGETSPKEVYNDSNYNYCVETYCVVDGESYGYKLTKYCNDSRFGYRGFTDDLTTLEPSDDAATVNWGDAWRMPTYEEMVELNDYCIRTRTTQNGINGLLVTGPNGNSIFLPAAGGYNNLNSANYLDEVGEQAMYWSSSLGHFGDNVIPTAATIIQFKSYYDSSSFVSISKRSYGQSVRPVVAH